MNDWQTNSCDIVGYEVKRTGDVRVRSNTLMIKGIRQKSKPNGEISKYFDVGDTLFIESNLWGSSKGWAVDAIVYNIDKEMEFETTVGIARKELDKFILMEFKKEQW